MRSLQSTIVSTLSIVIAVILLPGVLSAQQMSSTNYAVTFDDLSGGGNLGASASYSAWGTVAEIGTPGGEGLSSASYGACSGFECLIGDEALTVAYSIQSTACGPTSSSIPPYNISLGTLSTGAVGTAVNRICVVVTGDAGGGIVVMGSSANGALVSQSTPAHTIPSQSEALVAGDPGYGFCSTNAGNGFIAQSPFDGTCGTVTGHVVGAITASPQVIWSSTGAVTRAYGDLLAKAAIAADTPAHNDYQDTLTLTVTATY